MTATANMMDSAAAVLHGTYVHEPPSVSEYASPPSVPWFNGRKLGEYEREVIEAAYAALRATDTTWRVAGRA